MKNIRRKVIPAIVVITSAVVAFSYTGCSTVPATEKESIKLERQAEVRIPEASFDTDFSREEYTILGIISGEGKVSRRKVEEGEKPSAEPEKRMPWEPKEPDYVWYTVYDYDRTYGTWTDEGTLSIDEISDGRIPHYEELVIKKMEKIAARIALFNAINSSDEIDAILLPKYHFSYEMEDEIEGKEWVVARTVKSVTAKMTGKAIRIKTDEELMLTYKEFPGLLDRKVSE